MAVWILAVDAGQQTSMHCHPKKSTSLVILGGTPLFQTLTDQYMLNQQEGLYIGSRVFHKTLNRSKNRAFLLEIESPVDKHDLVRYEDKYGREDAGYERLDACELSPGLTLKDDFSFKLPQKRFIGSSVIQVGYAHDIEELTRTLRVVGEGLLTILDRNLEIKWRNIYRCRRNISVVQNIFRL